MVIGYGVQCGFRLSLDCFLLEAGKIYVQGFRVEIWVIRLRSKVEILSITKTLAKLLKQWHFYNHWNKQMWFSSTHSTGSPHTGHDCLSVQPTLCVKPPPQLPPGFILPYLINLFCIAMLVLHPEEDVCSTLFLRLSVQERGTCHTANITMQVVGLI